MATVLIALDSYDEVFSDFDVRSYESRALSQDFLDELRARQRNVGKITEIVLTLPKRMRSKKKEPLITRRIKDFFSHKISATKHQKRRTVVWALAYFAMGAAIFGIIINLPEQLSWLYDFALFPAWYLSWVGLDKVRELPRLDARERHYREIVEAKITFEDEEAYED